MDAKGRNVIAAPIACIHKIAAWVDPALPWIIAHGRCFPNPFQHSIHTDGEYRDRVVEPVGGVKKLAVRRNQDLRSKARSCESCRQSRHGLLRRKRTAFRIVMEEDYVGRFFLDCIEPMTFGMKCKMAGPIAGGNTRKNTA